jgi:hypothetical protein
MPVDRGAAAKFPLALPALKSHNSQPMNHSSNDLIMLFNDLFRETHRTVLVKGSGEPEYIPAEGTHGLAQVVFAHGYYASALHEISHWCVLRVRTVAHFMITVTGTVRTVVPRNSNGRLSRLR